MADKKHPTLYKLVQISLLTPLILQLILKIVFRFQRGTAAAQTTGPTSTDYWITAWQYVVVEFFRRRRRANRTVVVKKSSKQTRSMFTDIELARPIGYVIKLILNVFVLQINSMLYVRKSFTKFVFLTFQQ